MPVRSLRSSILKWPDRPAVDQSARRWAARVAATHPEVLRVGYFGSYARGNWGVGSDLDLVVLVEASDLPFHVRSTRYPTEDLPVPSDVLVYTAAEWQSGERHGFLNTIDKEAVWVFLRGRE